MRQPTYIQRVSTPYLTVSDRLSLGIAGVAAVLAAILQGLG